MLKKAGTSIALPYGIIGGVVTWVYILSLALLGLENPYNNIAEFSSTLIFVPVFVVLGIQGFKKYINPEMGFGHAFAVGLGVTFFLAFTTALLMGIYSQTFGSDLIQDYIVEMQKQMELNQTIASQKISEQDFEALYQDLGRLNAFQLAQRSFIYRFIAGFFVCVVSSVYFRK